jgi:hypothetical protein
MEEPVKAVLPDGTTLEFPAGTPDAVVDRTVRNHVSGMAPKEPKTFMGGVRDVLGMMTQRGARPPIPAVMALNAASDAYGRGAYELGGAVTDLASNMNASPEVAAGAGYVANVGMQAIPTLFGGQLAKAVATEPMKAAGRTVMQSALKPTIQDLNTGKATRAIDTLLKEGINPTKGGVEELRTMVNTLGDDVERIIANSPATIQKGEVGKSLLDTFNQFKNQVNPQADLETIKKAWLAFRNHPALIGKQDIPVQVAQQMKQGTYAQLAKKYGQMGSADIEAQKALARGLKDQISKAVPEVAPLNARQSELINAMNVAERRAMMDSNRNLLSLSPLANGPAGFAAFMADRSAWIKGLLARALYSGSGAVPGAAGQVAAGALASETGQDPDVERGALYRFLRGD